MFKYFSMKRTGRSIQIVYTCAEIPMYKIYANKKIAPDIFRLEITAPLVADKFKAGQFVVVRPSSQSERVPLTIMRGDQERGTIFLVVKAIGLSTRELCGLPQGAEICDLLGPLGQPSEIDDFGTVVIVGGGVGSAVAFAVADALKKAGNRIITISGARSKEFVILENEFAEISEELIITTDDGSYGRHGFVTNALESLYAGARKIDRVIAAGPVPMMKLVSDITRQHNTPTIASLNPVMVDGIGMCGGCRVVVGGEIRFACVDGPEFDAHLVDFDSLMRRNTAYREIEQRKENECKLDAAVQEEEKSE